MKKTAGRNEMGSKSLTAIAIPSPASAATTGTVPFAARILREDRALTRIEEHSMTLDGVRVTKINVARSDIEAAVYRLSEGACGGKESETALGYEPVYADQ
jgi:hypothetical protein